MTNDNEVTHTFKTSKDFADWLGKKVYEIDRNKSEFIRTCILLSADTILANPCLCHRIQFEDRKKQS